MLSDLASSPKCLEVVNVRVAGDHEGSRLQVEGNLLRSRIFNDDDDDASECDVIFCSIVTERPEARQHRHTSRHHSH